MMGDRPIDRRRLLGNLICLGGVAILAGPRRSLAWASAHGGSEPSGDALIQLIRHRESACVIGRAYLRKMPADEDAGRLRDAILDRLGLDDRAAAAIGAGRLRQRLRERVRADFREGRTVKLEGWILSRTEARLSALIALL